MSNLKQEILQNIENTAAEMIEISDFIHDNPELGNEEHKAVKLLTSFYEENNFEVKRNVANIETAFEATYKQGENGPVIGLLCEYDALMGLGHACGHNLQPAVMASASIAFCKRLPSSVPLTIKIIGTPAEESTSAKIPMTEAGIFDELDIALMMHGGDRTTVDGKSLACNNVSFTFYGKESHAAVAPEKGRSALDSVLMTFNGIEYLREHVTTDVRIHGVITDGGIQPNIVPEKATAEFSIRAQSREYLNEVVERVYNVARGAALATGTKLEIKERKKLESKFNVPKLNAILMNNAEISGAKQITPPREKTGSTDFSIVTHRVPGACIRVAFVPLGVPNHTSEWEKAGKSNAGHEAIVTGAKILAGTICDLLEDPSLLTEIKEEFQLEKDKSNNYVEA